MSDAGGVIHWVPDDMITDAVSHGRVMGRDLAPEDERWVVASLSEKGWSSREIADRLGRTPRHVKRLRAEVLVQVMRLLIAERGHTALLLERIRVTGAHNYSW